MNLGKIEKRTLSPAGKRYPAVSVVSFFLSGKFRSDILFLHSKSKSTDDHKRGCLKTHALDERETASFVSNWREVAPL